MIIQVNFIGKWRLKNNHNYIWTTCKKLVNLKTSRLIKKTINGSKAGYYINRKFIYLDDLKSELELIPKKELIPF